MRVDWRSHPVPDLGPLSRKLGAEVMAEIEARAARGEGATVRTRRLKRSTVERYARDGIAADRTPRFHRTGRLLSSLAVTFRATARGVMVIIFVNDPDRERVAAILANMGRKLLGLPAAVAMAVLERARAAVDVAKTVAGPPRP